ncbi:formamidopyrimidine-DNA glycosylase, partial [candidate division KSB1 bacterium]|nr:formamidopyrimidine-DNA glycosylase [candidate division KSB1 bacterium]
KFLRNIRLSSMFFLRTAIPPLDSVIGKQIEGFLRIGKRIVFLFPDEFFLVLHLMIAGRLRWREKNARIPAKVGLAAFDFDHGTLLITEAGTKKRAALFVVQGKDRLSDFDPGGLDLFKESYQTFKQRLLKENHTLKRALTDQRLFSGIGNAYSDEILFHARLSPVQMTAKLTEEQVNRLYEATLHILEFWTDKLRRESENGFPEKVTAFHPDMAVHGRYQQPCRVCTSPILRIRYADNETNYCALCQTNGKVLADRGLSRLLKKDWPRTLEALENMRALTK